MIGQLEPTTEAGAKFVSLAEEHSADFATRAADHDRNSTFPREKFEAMQRSGFMAGPVPVEFGGLGVTSLLDIALGLSRIGRGCASTAIAANMHITAAFVMSRLHTAALAGVPGTPAALLEGLMRGVVGGQVIAGVFGTEAGTAIAYPQAEVTRDGDSFVLNGHKIFGALSPIATVIFSPARLAGENGEYEAVMAMLGPATPGVEIRDNWDAMGMRASGSNDVVYTGVRLGVANVIQTGEPLGRQLAGGIEMNVAGNLGLIAAFMGIAEAASEIAIDLATKRRKGPSNQLMAERSWMQHLVGEMMVDVETCRAMVSRAGMLIDDSWRAFRNAMRPRKRDSRCRHSSRSRSS